MQWQLALAIVTFGATVVVATLMATGRIAGPAKTIGIWSAARPGIPRQWLEVAFWGGLALAAASSVIILGTAGGVLSARWSDVGQMLVWAALALDAVLGGRRLWAWIGFVLVALSGWQVVTGFK